MGIFSALVTKGILVTWSRSRQTNWTKYSGESKLFMEVLPMDYRGRVGSLVTVTIPENKSIFGIKLELEGLTGAEIKSRGSSYVLEFVWWRELDVDNINNGLNEFLEWHPYVKIQFSYSSKRKASAG